MKTNLTALALIAATALSLTPKPTYAGDKERALIGGLIGGIIIGAAINESRHDDDSRTTKVIVRDRDDRCETGYWKEVRVRVWEPGYWVVERSRRGCETRRYVEGRYVYRTERVWVAYDRRGRHHDRDVSYGYGRYR